MHKYNLSVCAIFKNESHAIYEWITHCLYHGFDHIYLINDGSTDEFKSIIDRFGDKVTLFDNDINHSNFGRQLDIYNKYITPILSETKWMAVLDLDEFLYSPNDINVANVLVKYENYNAIRIPWLLFGSNGHKTQPMLLVDSFTKCQGCRDPNVKTIFKTDYFVKFDVHYTEVIGDVYRLKDEEEDFVLNHYRVQSYDFFMNVKGTRGDVNNLHVPTSNIMQRDDSFFKIYDLNHVIDERLSNQNKCLNNDILKHCPKYVGCVIQGGLGNNLFQLAYLNYVANISKRIPYIEKNFSPHSNSDYFTNIFKNIQYPTDIKPNQIDVIWENNLEEIDNGVLNNSNNILFVGYFQNYKYVTDEFIDKLSFDSTILNKYPNIRESVFIHIRGGDYKSTPSHFVDMKNYYERSIKLFDKDTEFYIFTNDKEYAQTFDFLNNIKYTFIDENELDSLYIMSQCKGGICTNSSFSWWGAYLNRNRKLILPSKWYNDDFLYTKGYYFPESIIVHV